MAKIFFDNITKKYASFTACYNVSIFVEHNTIHSIIGENGAGKSTLVKMLGGIEEATEGSIKIDNELFKPKSAQDAFKKKIAFIHQHFVLAENLTALENLILSYQSSKFSLLPISKSEVRREAEKLIKQFGWSLQLDAKVFQLSVGEQQRLEILKALLQSPDIIIFDEPTAVLSPSESNDLMDFILGLKNSGKTILLISHKLNEVKKVSDNISILRGGKHIQTSPSQLLSTEEIASLIIGKKTIREDVEYTPSDKIALNITPLNLQIFKGEILGVAGIEGNGQSAFIQLTLDHLNQNNISYGDITEDRLRLSVFPSLNLSEHMLLKHNVHFIQNGLVNQKGLSIAANEVVSQWDVRPNDIEKSLSLLSGGNQQKFIVGRELWNEPEFLIAAHPSRGVDIGAQAHIHSALNSFVKKYNSVLLVSSDLDEIFKLCRRYLVLNKNQVYGPFEKNELDEKNLGLYLTGQVTGSSAPKFKGLV